jgi:hypothetical protein
VEPDGTVRIVEYTSDKHNGFNAIVKKVGVFRLAVSAANAHLEIKLLHAAQKNIQRRYEIILVVLNIVTFEFSNC